MKASIALAELDRTECLRLLGTAVVGRIVFTEDALPAIRPVNFLLDGDEIVFRTGTGSTLAAATRHSVVAFEVDEIDTRTHTGWSVVVVGQAYEIADIDRLVRLAHPEYTPWPPSRTAHTIAIPVHHLSGRRLILRGPA
ncbi:MAG TPA: pyridoxamine 5'-phosphate oxidase family protein [Pseudonocardiaceae bacterium]|jgi:nitroimidazol reductase NimA-like FMN-containing flavoprotein (pyridoxamine 5'-phosphate oxidase superfamily)